MRSAIACVGTRPSIAIEMKSHLLIYKASLRIPANSYTREFLNHEFDGELDQALYQVGIGRIEHADAGHVYADHAPLVREGLESVDAVIGADTAVIDAAKGQVVLEEVDH